MTFLCEKAEHTVGDACAGQNEPMSRHVVEEQCLFRGMDAPPARGSENFGSLGRARVDLFTSEDNSHCPIFFYKEHGCPGPRMAQPSALCFPSSHSATAGAQASQGTTAQAYSNSPPLEEPTVGVRVIPAAESSPVADPLETGPPLSSEQQYMIYRPCMCGRSTGAFRPSRACPKHYGRS